MWPELHGALGTAIHTGLEEEAPRLAGLEYWPNVLFGSSMEFENTDLLKDLSGAAVDISDIDTLARKMLLNNSDFGQGSWELWCHPNTRAYMHDYQISYRDKPDTSKEVGFLVDYINLKIGKRVPIYDDIYMPEHQLYLVDMDKIGYGYFKNDRMERREMPTMGRNRAWQISCQLYGLVIRQAPVSIGLIKYAASA